MVWKIQLNNQDLKEKTLSGTASADRSTYGKKTLKVRERWQTGEERGRRVETGQQNATQGCQ